MGFIRRKKNLRNKIVLNASWIIVCRIIQSALNFFVLVLSARYLGPSNYGLISYAASCVAFILPIASLGFPNVLVQEIINTPKKEGETLGTALGAGCLSSICCIFFTVALINIINKGETETIIVTGVYSISLLFQSLEMIQYWFQAKFYSKYTAVVSLISYIIVSIYKILLLIFKKNVLWFAFAYSIDYAIIAITLIIIFKRKTGNKLSFSLNRAFTMFSKSKYYIFTGIMITVFTQSDKVMLKGMIGNSATGYYSAAVTCAGITGFVINAIIDSARPAIFESLKISREKFESNMANLYSVVIYFCLIQSVFTMIFAPIIIKIIYGKDYLASISVLMIVTWYVPFACLGTVRNIWILANDKQKYLLGINLFGGIFNIFLNFLLIPIIGVNGAAAASFLSQSSMNVVLGFIIKPIRKNNELMIRGLNPKYIFEMLQVLRKS